MADMFTELDRTLRGTGSGFSSSVDMRTSADTDPSVTTWRKTLEGRNGR